MDLYIVGYSLQMAKPSKSNLFEGRWSAKILGDDIILVYAGADGKNRKIRRGSFMHVSRRAFLLQLLNLILKKINKSRT